MANRTYTDDALTKAVKSSLSLREAILKLGLCGRGGGSYYSVKEKIEKLNLNTDHFKGQGWSKGCIVENRRKNPADIFKQKKLSSNDKKKLITSGLLENKCQICGALPVWNNLPLVLQLDHIDGDRSNNEQSNLRLLCPNCHTQTETFSCKRLKKEKVLKGRCKARPSTRKVERPSVEELDLLLSTMSFCAVGRKYGVSDNAIRKWKKSYE
jgi:hypothetical protein